MSSEKDKILEFKEYMKSDKMTYTEYLILKIDGRANNPDKSWITKIGEHIPWGYSMSTIWGFDPIEDRHTLFRGKDGMKKFC